MMVYKADLAGLARSLEQGANALASSRTSQTSGRPPNTNSTPWSLPKCSSIVTLPHRSLLGTSRSASLGSN